MLNSSSTLTIDRHPATISPDASVAEAIVLMNQVPTACILVTVSQGSDQTLVGRFQEQDAVRLIASKTRLDKLSVAAAMTTQIVTISETEAHNTVAVEKIFHQHRIESLPVVNAIGALVGAIAPPSIQDNLQSNDFLQVQPISDVMDTHQLHVPETASLLELAQLFAQEDLSCIAITQTYNSGDNDEDREIPLAIPPRSLIPTGIVTKRDIVRSHQLGLDLSIIPASEINLPSLLQIRPTDSIWAAYQKMYQHQIQQLVVSNDRGILIGIITQNNILQAIRRIEHEQLDRPYPPPIDDYSVV